MALGLIVVTTGLAIWGVVAYDRYLYYANISKELAAEEAGEEQFDSKAGPSEADRYVSDFKQVVDVSVSAGGFSPANIVVAPDTKLIFKASDNVAHFVQVIPGAKAPKFFDPKLDLVKGTVFQTKVVEAGSYSFYDKAVPTNNLTVTVVK